jgi:two-component system response regulator FlrC
VNHQPACHPLLLWLDPWTAPSESHVAAMERANLRILVVKTLDELSMHAHLAKGVVIRLKKDIQLLIDALSVCQHAETPLKFICRVDRGQVSLAAKASQAGADHVFAEDDCTTENWQELSSPDPEPAAPAVRANKPKHVVFVDPVSQHLLALAQRVAQADVTALLVGPTGSGKEVLAHVLHEYSSYRQGPFVALNCAAMPDHLIEDMLFGHEKGAFTGAHKDYKGMFEQAQGGTLFLDEIGEMPLHLQSKLLRVLQERQLVRLGGHQTINLNLRIVAATNRDLKAAIEAKEFREDLYYRIATFRLRLLPLSERPGDIIPLAVKFLQQNQPTNWVIADDAKKVLLEYPWPGNVRELENVMRRAMVLCPDRILTAAHLMFDDWASTEVSHHGLDSLSYSDSTPAMQMPKATDEPGPAQPIRAANGQSNHEDLGSVTRNSEHQLIMKTLSQTSNREEAAKRLGISPRTLRYKLAQFKAMGMSLAA